MGTTFVGNEGAPGIGMRGGDGSNGTPELSDGVMNVKGTLSFGGNGGPSAGYAPGGAGGSGQVTFTSGAQGGSATLEINAVGVLSVPRWVLYRTKF